MAWEEARKPNGILLLEIKVFFIELKTFVKSLFLLTETIQKKGLDKSFDKYKK